MKTLTTILSIGFLFVCASCSPVDKQKATATAAYWEQIRATFVLPALAMKKVEASKTAGEALSSMSGLRDTAAQASQKLGSLSVVDVDPDLVSHSAKFIVLLNELEKMVNDYLRSERDSKSFETFTQRYNGWQQKGLKLESEELTLRSLLSQRYKIEFPAQ